MIEKIASKEFGKAHEVRVERSVYNDCSFVYVMVINHDVCRERKEFFDTEEEAVAFLERFKTVKDCKNFITGCKMESQGQ